MQPFWSISETCVWAATRDLDAVAIVHDKPDSAHWFFADAPPIGYGSHVIAWRCHLLDLAGADPLPDPWEAYKQLPARCGDGLLTMYGVARDDGNIEPIPTAAWAALEISYNSRGGYVADMPLALRNPGAQRWTQLRLRSTDVQRIWPPIEAAAEQPRPQSVTKPRKPNYDEILAWYVERVAKHPPDCLPPSRPDDEAAARQYFDGKGLDGRGLRDDVRKARKQGAPPSWQERGAKSSEAYEADRKARASAA
jgi:hypothetical protein